MLTTRLRKNLDMPLLALTYLLAAIGVVVIYTVMRDESAAFHKKQALWIALGSVGLVAAALVDYHRCARFAKRLYLLNLILLALVLHSHFHNKVNGAARWIKIGGFPFQPSEFAKVIIILTLAVFLARRHETITEVKTLLLSFVYVAVPVALILKQPDLGTALVLLAIWLGMVTITGAKLKHLAVFVLVGGMLFVGAWHSGKFIREYQKERLIAFINPEEHAKKTGYHVLQARLAIGSGQMWGKGIAGSTQVHGGYIPEKQTDFIFTAIGEEFGFIGAVLVTLLYAAIMLRGTLIIASANEDILGKLIATGIITMFGFHVVVNIGMNIGILPVAGIPLFLISYGGSNVLLSLTCIGLLQSIAIHRHQLLF